MPENRTNLVLVRSKIFNYCFFFSSFSEVRFASTYSSAHELTTIFDVVYPAAWVVSDSCTALSTYLCTFHALMHYPALLSKKETRWIHCILSAVPSTISLASPRHGSEGNLAQHYRSTSKTALTPFSIVRIRSYRTGGFVPISSRYFSRFTHRFRSYRTYLSYHNGAFKRQECLKYI